MGSIKFSLLACMLIACVAADVLVEPQTEPLVKTDAQAKTLPVDNQPLVQGEGKPISVDVNARTKKDVLLNTISYPYIHPAVPVISRAAYPLAYQPYYYPYYQYYPGSVYYVRK